MDLPDVIELDGATLIRIDAPEMLMDEALICLRERSNGKLVSAFYDIARKLTKATD